MLLMTINHRFKYAKHCYSLPCDNFTRASLSGLCDYTTCSPYRSWSSKIYDVISSVYCEFDVLFNENALHHPALPLYVQEHPMLKYQRTWLSSINKGFNPNKPNKLKVYASIKKSFSLQSYVSCYNIFKRRNFTLIPINLINWKCMPLSKNHSHYRAMSPVTIFSNEGTLLNYV